MGSSPTCPANGGACAEFGNGIYPYTLVKIHPPSASSCILRDTGESIRFHRPPLDTLFHRLTGVVFRKEAHGKEERI